MRGDLSAPVLAIIVTIGIIAAGLVLLAWFWWFAPQAGKIHFSSPELEIILDLLGCLKLSYL